MSTGVVVLKSVRDGVKSSPSTGGERKDNTTDANTDPALRLAVALDGAGMVLMGAIHLVLVKFLTIAAANYATAVSLHSVVWSIPLLVPYCLVQWWRGKLTREHIIIPDRNFVILSFFVALASMLTFYSSQFTSGPLQVLLGQCTIPYSMIISWWYLGTRYNSDHYIGALMVTMGIVVAIGHELRSSGVVSVFDAAWIFGNLISKIPFAIVTVYLEAIYRTRSELDPLYFFLLLSVFQIPFLALLTLPCTYLSRPVVPLTELHISLWRGTLCLAGINSLPDDQCYPWAPIIHVVNTVVTVLLIIPLFRLPKNGGSDMVWLCSALRVPLANLAFSLPFLPESVPVSWGNGLALVIIILGILVFGYGGKDSRVTKVAKGLLEKMSKAANSVLPMLKSKASALPPIGARQQCEDFL